MALADDLITEFRTELADRGFVEFNATNELLSPDRTLVVTTTHAYKEWTVAVKPAAGSTDERQDLVRVRLNQDGYEMANREKLDQVRVELGY